MKRSEVLSLLLCYSFEKEFKKFSDKFTIKIDEKEYPDEIFWFIDDKYFMDYDLKNNYLWCRYYDFWEYFKIKFNFNSIEVRYLIKYTIEKHFKLNGVTPPFWFQTSRSKVEKHFKLNGVTPTGILKNIMRLVEKHFKLNGVTPNDVNKRYLAVVEKHFKLNGVTPSISLLTVLQAVEEHFNFNIVTK